VQIAERPDLCQYQILQHYIQTDETERNAPLVTVNTRRVNTMTNSTTTIKILNKRQ